MTGAVPHSSSWLWLIGAILVVSVVLAAGLFNPLVAVHLFLGAFFYGVVYTLWLKRRTAWNIVVGGASGSFAVPFAFRSTIGAAGERSNAASVSDTVQ